MDCSVAEVVVLELVTMEPDAEQAVESDDIVDVDAVVEPGAGTRKEGSSIGRGRAAWFVKVFAGSKASAGKMAQLKGWIPVFLNASQIDVSLKACILAVA